MVSISADKPVILVVDDDVPLLRALVRGLSRAFTVVSAASVAQAQAVAAQRLMDGLLCDYKMGDGTGLMLMERLRAGGCRAPAVLHTAEPGLEAIKLAVASGLLAAVLGKPTPIAHITATLLTVLTPVMPGVAAVGALPHRF